MPKPTAASIVALNNEQPRVGSRRSALVSPFAEPNGDKICIKIAHFFMTYGKSSSVKVAATTAGMFRINEKLPKNR